MHIILCMRRWFTIKHLFCDITDSIFGYHKFYFLISKIHCDIISQNQKKKKKWLCDIKKSNLWYHKIDFLIWKISMNFWYHKTDFVRSQIRFFDITKSMWFLYITKSISSDIFCDIKKIEFVMSQNRGFIVKRSSYIWSKISVFSRSIIFDIKQCDYLL